MLTNIAVWTRQDFKVFQCVWLLFNIMNERVKKITQGLSQRYLLLFALSLLVVLFLSLLDKSNPCHLLIPDTCTNLLIKALEQHSRNLLLAFNIDFKKVFAHRPKISKESIQWKNIPKSKKQKNSTVILGSLSFSLLQLSMVAFSGTTACEFSTSGRSYPTFLFY